MIILGVMFILLVIYLWRNKAIQKEQYLVRDLHDDYHRYVQDLLNGFQEVKISTVRNRNIFERFIVPNQLRSKRIRTLSSIKYFHNELMGRYSWYVVIGAVLFGFPRVADIEIAKAIVFVVTILWLLGPVDTLISLVPFYNTIRIAWERINALDAKPGSQSSYTEPPPLTLNTGEFESITFKNVTYAYRERDKSGFVFGPVDLELRSGQIVFVTGGNGSGKSTFINLLVNSFKPESGEIFVNGIKVSDGDGSSFNSIMAAIFTSNYLFNYNYDSFSIGKNNTELLDYLRLVKLEDVVTFDVDKGIITQSLSKGQKKRLALVYALLENKEIIVLDEWAAEQDPEFRKYFYHNILNVLRGMGKTVICVTHDENYFNCADRLIKFDYGKITADRPIPSLVIPADNERN